MNVAFAILTVFRISEVFRLFWDRICTEEDAILRKLAILAAQHLQQRTAEESSARSEIKSFQLPDCRMWNDNNLRCKIEK